MRIPDILRVIAVVLMAYAVVASLNAPATAEPGQHLHASALP